MEFRIVTPAGETRVINGHGVLERDATNVPQRLKGTAQDITTRKRADIEREKLQAQLQQSQKMDSIGQLTGGIAHDFNNMLATILGYAEMITQTSAHASKAQTLQYVSKIVLAGNRAKELIAQMLVYSRLQPEIPVASLPPILLQPVIKEAASLLRSSIPSTIEMKYHIADANLRARIQPVQLHQILMNLAINARDAIGEYGQIEVTVDRHTVAGPCNSCHMQFTGDFVEITVSDTGNGIKESALNNIFDPFFTTKEVGKGTGMGLSVVHGIVHSAGGHLLVDSTLGKGTVFRILLPFSAEPEAQTPIALLPPAETHSEAKHVRPIMVVDDEPELAELMGEIIETAGFSTRVFTHSGDALTAFRAEPNAYAALFTDQTMPGMTGLDLMREVRKLKPNLPVLIATGFSTSVTPENAASLGITRLLQKPVATSQIRRAVQEVLKANATQLTTDGPPK